MVRPERFELSTTWFEVADTIFYSLLFNKLDSLPSPNLPLKAAKDVYFTAEHYVFHLNVC